jgi:eukaryotic-like serine/threonine-protein kinase
MREVRALTDRRRQLRNSPRGIALLMAARAQEEYAAGNLDQARAFFNEAKKLGPPEQLYDPESAVRLAAAIGDLTFAEAAATARLARFPSSPIWRDWYGPADRAAIALARGKPAETLTLTDAIQPRTFYRGFVPALRGQAQLQLKNAAGAVTEFQTVIDHPGIFPGDQAMARVGLARAHVISSDSVKAKKPYEEFFEFWKRADPDLPLLIQAKAEYANLKN